MIIFKDVVYGTELFTDALPIKPVGDDTDCFTWVSKRIQEKSGDIDASLLGGNASQEEAAEETEEAVKMGFDFEIYGNEIEKCPEMGSKDFKLWFKSYCKKAIKSLGAKYPDRVEAAKASALKFFAKYKDQVKDLDFYSGPAQDDEEYGMVYGNLIVVVWHDDGMSADCFCWRGGLEEEKA